MACDLSHIETPAKVTGFIGAEQLGDAVADCDIVVIPAGNHFSCLSHGSFQRMAIASVAALVSYVECPSIFFVHASVS